MTPAGTLPDAVIGVLLDRLYDDASLFPPAELPIGQAVSEHLAHLASPHAAVVGPFVVSPSVLGDLHAALEVALAGPVADVRAALSAAPSPRVTSIEVSGSLSEALAMVVGRAGYVEVGLRRTAGEVRADVNACAENGVSVKFRTGGMTADTFPTEAELAVGLHASVVIRRPFKLTAGLHHPVRHTDPVTGFEHHGLLNVVLAVEWAQRGASVDQIAAVLADHDQAAIVDAVADLSRETMTTIRSAFRSVGTCSIDECLAGLAAVGLVRSGGAAA